MNSGNVSKWQRELLSFRGIKGTFIVEGNINDKYPYMSEADGSLTSFFDLSRTLYLLYNGCERPERYDFLYCNPITGFYNPVNNDNLRELVAESGEGGSSASYQEDPLYGTHYQGEGMEDLGNRIKRLLIRGEVDGVREKPIVVVVNFASRYLTAPSEPNKEEIKLFLSLLMASGGAKKIDGNKNTLFLIVDNRTDVPVWFYRNNPSVRTLAIPNPDKKVRSLYIDRNFKELDDESVKEKLVDLTDGLKIPELAELKSLYRNGGFTPEEMPNAVYLYKYGIKESMWQSVSREKVSNAEAIIGRRVKGQPEAVKQTVRVIKRAVTGMSGLQHSSGEGKPRGVLFFAGPTGTGKTELAKSIAELLFGDENNCIRFDMSEYSQEQSDQKLFGAPPGYVGYENGGQLTNQVKERPFSILLFDEIEKAHPSIMDKFLQILEDGRMTDGQGNTVYFSESLILFTSNLGISKTVKGADGTETRIALVNPEEEYGAIVGKVQSAIKNYFKPEVLNRLGNNIVVFDFIRDESAKAIVRMQMENIHARLRKKTGITVMAEETYEYFYGKAMEGKVRAMGGRGIGNLLEEEYINALAEYIFDANVVGGPSPQTDGGKVVVRVRDGKLEFGQME